MAKVELKTKKNDGDVDKFLNSVESEQRRKDAKIVTKLMEEITGEKPVMWGSSIIGFGTYHYKSPATGREGDWMRIAVSPRKQNLTVYLLDGFSEYSKLLAKLGKHKTGKSCLYINKLEDVDMDVLSKMIKKSYESKALGET
ncbi:MAG TPA: DUF1801 domain-containing protein [Candidatus Saccharimonadales bacterium]|nr:DUF1801 domain-containing protein [Candidatus Saccharimonadales bacterium]